MLISCIFMAFNGFVIFRICLLLLGVGNVVSDVSCALLFSGCSCMYCCYTVDILVPYLWVILFVFVFTGDLP